MIFLSSLYRRLKLGLGGAGSICGLIGVIGGSMTGGVLFIVVGGVALAASTMLVVDTMSAYSAIKKDVDRLTASVKEHADHIENMRDSNEDYSLLLAQDKKMLENERKVNEQLKSTINQSEMMVKGLKATVSDMNLVCQGYDEKIKEFSNENSNLHDEISRLSELYTKTKQLIHGMTALDTSLAGTHQSFSSTHEEYEATLGKLNKLINDIKNKTFNDLDGNGDGLISRKEFERYITK